MGLRDMRYSDRDVREDDVLVGAAYEYLEGYQGEFEFLIDCKMRASQGTRLSVGMVRGVLNCMRNDPRVKGMPDPLPAEEGTVTQLRTPYAPKRDKPQRQYAKRYMGQKPCGDGQIFVSWHERHDWEDDEAKYTCPGLYKINRGKVDGGYVDLGVDMKVTLKRPYIAGRTGRLVHLADQAWCRWTAKQHESGFHGVPVLVVMPKCGKPWNLKNPLLLTESGASFLIFSDEERSICKRCEGAS